MNTLAQLKMQREALFTQFKSDLNVNKLTKVSCDLTDQQLLIAWNESGLSNQAALVGVGGFGRGELFPYSDVDILVLLSNKLSEADLALINPKIEAFITRCWDLGIEIGSSVRNIDECLHEAAGDITVRTSMLESRWIGGDKKVYRDFLVQFDAAMDSKAFYQAKLLELRQRHHKYNDTPYSLEPNCKESPGGLRDLQVILWMTKAAKLGNSFSDLHKKGLLTKRESLEINRNLKFLQTLRTQLHLIAKRRQDVLVFDLQTQLAESFGLEPDSGHRASEKIMRRYYWAAKAVTQLNEILLQNIEAILFPKESRGTRPVSEHFVEKQDVLDIVDPLLFEKHPDQILRAFLLYTKTPGVKGFSAQILRGLYNARNLMNAQWRNDPQNKACFIEIVKQSEGVTQAFRLMNQTSVLGRYLPAFRKIVGQMQHDLFHVYTVDQHILMVLRNVRRFLIVEHTHEFPYCSQLAANFDKPWLLILAALFHDIAKGRGGDHSELGKRDARLFAKSHGLDKEETELLVWLVSEHLTMSQVAQKQDIGDPDVIKAFAKRVKTDQRLTALYLLTVADVRGTSPKVWNAWKGKLLEDLYKLTLRVIGGGEHDLSSELEQHQDEAKKLLRLFGLQTDAHEKLWQQLDISFFLRHEPSDIAWLTKHLYSRTHSEDPIVRARLSPIGEGLQVAVYIKDEADLFAKICSYFDQQGFSILDARVHTTQHGYALDTFQISDTNLLREGGHYRDIIQLVEHGLTELLKTHNPLPTPNQGRLSRQSRSFPIQPRVSLRPDERGQHFVLSISASDRAGLLYTVAKILAEHQISLHTAQVNTLGERIEDVFLLTAHHLNSDPKLQIKLETELLDALAI
jgi:[protein-PII] uridylyltransferase